MAEGQSTLVTEAGRYSVRPVAIQRKKGNYVLDADIRSFFDTLDHEWPVKFIQHRSADPRVIRHVKKWLNAGALEQGRLMEQEEGVPQGGSISPLSANIYLHYASDLRAERRSKRGEGKPATFDFPGFTHCCGKSRQGTFRLLRLTIAERLRAKPKQIKFELRRRMHEGWEAYWDTRPAYPKAA
jgi:retron-type reverse transcriptase